MVPREGLFNVGHPDLLNQSTPKRLAASLLTPGLGDTCLLFHCLQSVIGPFQKSRTARYGREQQSCESWTRLVMDCVVSVGGLLAADGMSAGTQS
jgi:hypothetical protein